MLISKSLINDYFDDLLLKALRLSREEYEEVKGLMAQAKENRLTKITDLQNKIKEMDDNLLEDEEKDRFEPDEQKEYNNYKIELKQLKDLSPTDMNEQLLLLRYPDKVKEFAPSEKMKDEAVIFWELIDEPTLSEKYRRLSLQFLEEAERHERDKSKKIQTGQRKERKEIEGKQKKRGKLEAKRRERDAQTERALLQQLRRELPESKVPEKVENFFSLRKPTGTGRESYTPLQVKLIELVGSMRQGDLDTNIARLEKFMKEHEMSTEEESKLNEIMEALKTDKKRKEKQTSLSTRASPEALKVKAEGVKLVQKSKGWKKDGGVSLKRSDGKTVSYTAKTSNELFKDYKKLDLRDENWVNKLPLRPIHNYWLKKGGYEKGSEKFLDEPREKQTKVIRKVMSAIPEYPKPTNILKRVYDTFWESERPISDNDPENFAYWMRGIQLGLSDKDSTMMDSFLNLQKFSNDTLPKLVDAIKKGVFIDSKGQVSFRLGPQISKVMNTMGTSKQRPTIRKRIIKDILDIVKGRGISTTYSGRDANELQQVENDIRSKLSETIKVGEDEEPKTILSYLLKTFMEVYNERAILSEILNNPEDSNIEIDYVKTQSPPKEPEKKKKVVWKPSNFEITEGPNRGQKLKNWVDKETKRLKNIENKDGSRKYTDDEIWQRVGWQKQTWVDYVRDFYGTKIKEKVPKILYGQHVRVPEYLDEDEPLEYVEGTEPTKTNVVGYIPYPRKQKKTMSEADRFSGRISRSGKLKKAIEYDTQLEIIQLSLNDLLYSFDETDYIMKEDKGTILESLDKKQKKKVKAVLNIADPTEYFGHDFLKLADLVEVLKSLGVVKGDKKLNKKILRLEDENLSVIKLASKLRKDYEKLYRQLRDMVYPKSGE